MPGPPPQPTYLRLLKGNPSRRPINPREPQPRQTEAPPNAPDYLTGYAADEWYRMSPELHRLGLLSVLDVSTLAIYCQAYGRWRTAEELLAEIAKRGDVTRGLLVKGPYGDARANPLLRISRAAAEQMLSAAAHFGLTPSTRARLSAGVGHEPRRSLATCWHDGLRVTPNYH
jgi:P27 family predicted phage terminase small subunit